MAEFEIIIKGYSTSVDEWARAKRAPKEELPGLTQEQKAFTRKFGISEEDYARSVLASHYGSERLIAEAQRFGSLLQEVVAGFKKDNGLKVDQIVYSPFYRRFTCHFREGSKGFSFEISSPRVADHLDSGEINLRERLKQLLLNMLEQARSQAVGASR